MPAGEEPVSFDVEARRTAIVRDLRARLWPACRDWPEELFSSMVEGLAEVTVRYEGRSANALYDRRATDRLVADLKEALTRNEESRAQDKG